MSNDKLLYFNGVNGDSGEYDLEPMKGEDLARSITGEAAPENLEELKHRKEAIFAFDGDPQALNETGWGVIFTHDADPAIKEALGPLLKLRQEQAGDGFKLFEGSTGFRRGKDTKSRFLSRQGIAPGIVQRGANVPYYLLIVGSPDDISYRFQSQLDVQYAVGRIHFDTVDEYANYARSVVAAETGRVKLAREAAFFGVANPDDPATQLSATQLVGPVRAKLATELPDWTLNAYLDEETTKKSQLQRLLGGDQTPAMLFTASHGMAFAKGSARQLPHQGALLCRDWPGPKNHQGSITQDFYFAGDDLSDSANLSGLIAFFFACYGGGTPALDEFAKRAGKKEREAIAPNNFLARLPTRMLGQPAGGALAVIGHVERAWGYSFMFPDAGTYTADFEKTLRDLMQGVRIGYAFENFNVRYAELASDLTVRLEDIEFGAAYDPYELAGMWTANNDARGYAILGDPAVRLALAEPGEQAMERPSITLASAPDTSADQPTILMPAVSKEPAEPAAVEIGGSTAAAAKVAPAASSEPEAADRAPAQVASSTSPSTHPAASTTTASASPDVVDYAIFDSDTLRQARAKLARGLEQFANRLGDALESMANLEVKTFVADTSIPTASRQEDGARLAAYTRISLAGAIENQVPEQGGQVNEALWRIHLESVAQASANREAMIKLAASAVSGLLDALKIV